MVPKRLINCQYVTLCSSHGEKCTSCSHNSMRNAEIDFYECAHDNVIPQNCPKLTYDGPPEQTAGYKCPVCDEYTNPYHLVDKRCRHCGYKLNV